MDTQFEQKQQQNTKPNLDSKLSRFSCKICLEVADQPVITPCGHLYCWKCIYQWAKVKPSCPFCNNKINVDKLTTIYTEEEDQTSSNNNKKQSTETAEPQIPRPNQREDNSNHEQEQQQQNQQQEQQNSQQNENNNNSQNQEDIPRRPQNPRENYENQGGQRGQGGFNFNFFGFPGLFLGGGLGLGGFTFNLNGFQFGGGQGHHHQPQGIQRYLAFLPIILIVIQIVFPLLSGLFGSHQNNHSYHNNDSYSRYDNHRSSSSNNSNKNRNSNRQNNYNNNYYRNQQHYDSYNHSDYEWTITEYGEVLCIIVLTFFIYFIGKIRNRQQQQQQR